MYEEAVQAAGTALNQSPVGRCNHVTRQWGEMQWKPSKVSSGADASLNVAGKPEVNVYPSFAKLDPERQQAVLMREFGKLLFRKAGDKVKTRWEKKLCLPLAAQIDAVQAAVASPEHETYKDLVLSFSTLMDRFVAANIANALIRVSHVHRANSRNIELRTYGSTMDYCNCRRYHPLVPFVTAYGYEDLADCPGVGLAEVVVWKMRHVREKSLADALQRLIVDLFDRCR
jgi:hypothetical protein